MRRNLRIFTFLFVFFIVVAVGSLMLLNGDTSVFNRNRDTIGAQTAVLTQTVIGEEPSDAASVEESIIEPEPEPIPEPEPEPEPIPEPEPEPEPVPEPEPEPEYEMRYFTYTVTTRETILRLRELPSTDAKILKKLERGSSGYILEPANDWSRIVTQDGMMGFSSSQYLTIDEISKEDFPVEYLDLVKAPTELLASEIFEANDDKSTAINSVSTEASSVDAAATTATTVTDGSEATTVTDSAASTAATLDAAAGASTTTP